MALIAPSLLAADFLHLQDVCEMVNNSAADRLHLDVMDGRFVPNISFGIPVIEQVSKVNKKVSEVHLMIVEPEKYIDAFHKAGADTLIIHLEACLHLHRNIEQIKLLGMKAGVAINPHTPVSMLADMIEDIDLVCMMSVNPGFGGQQFIPHTLSKIAELRKLITDKNINVDIEIDGGMAHQNILNDPYHPSNNRWRIKPAHKESAAAIHKRVSDCVKFYALYYRDHIKRHKKVIEFIGLPEIFRWYNGAIGLPMKGGMDESWVNCFYNRQQAEDAYDILNELIVKNDFDWPTNTPGWHYRTHSVLEQMYEKLTNP